MLSTTFILCSLLAANQPQPGPFLLSASALTNATGVSPSAAVDDEEDESDDVDTEDQEDTAVDQKSAEPTASSLTPKPAEPVRTPGAAERSCTFNNGYDEGKQVAEEEGSSGWLGVGLAGGCCGNCTGCLASSAFGYVWPDAYDVEINRCKDSFQYTEGMKKGYLEVKRKSNAINAFTGGAIGTAVIFGLYFLLILL
jgi:hypothetical protein